MHDEQREGHRGEPARDELDTLRRFHRSYTRRIGAPDESSLGSGRPLGPSRLLVELGGGPVRVLDLRRRTGLDSGYLSRLLRRLEDDGLVSVHRDQADGRQRIAELTAAGRREWRRLDRRSTDVAERLLAPLSDRQRGRLVAALATADRLLRTATVTSDVVDPASDAARAAIEAYFGELDLRFRAGFDPGDAGAGDDAAAMRAPDGAFLVLRDEEAIVGCGGVRRIDAAVGEIKRMWIHPAWRGVGLGVRLLAELEAAARWLGRTRVVLDTNEVLTEAVAMYLRAGYTPIERYNDNPYAHHWFAKAL